MKEKTSTNLEVIDVKLFDDRGVDTLLFLLPGVKNGISVNLNETSGQKDLKLVFEKILNRLNTKDIELRLSIDEQFKKGLYKEVCVEYISDLNNEIKAVRAEIQKL